MSLPPAMNLDTPSPQAVRSKRSQTYCSPAMKADVAFPALIKAFGLHSMDGVGKLALNADGQVYHVSYVNESEYPIVTLRSSSVESSNGWLTDLSIAVCVTDGMESESCVVTLEVIKSAAKDTPSIFDAIARIVEAAILVRPPSVEGAIA